MNNSQNYENTVKKDIRTYTTNHLLQENSYCTLLHNYVEHKNSSTTKKYNF